MTKKTLWAAALAAALAPAPLAFAKSPPPLVPSALVEDIKAASSDVEFMDYVGAGQVIELKPSDVLVLSYLKSCAHETITGGKVHVGSERSEVEGGKIARTKVPCSGGKISLSSQQANASAASAFRLQSVAIEPVLYATPPMVQVNGGGMLLIERLDRPGERHEVQLGEMKRGEFYDLNKANMKPALARGGIYRATLNNRKITFKIDRKAKTGKAPVVSRLLRFTPG